MQAGAKLSVSLAATVLAGGALSLGAVAGAAQPPPNPGQDGSGNVQPRPPQEEENQPRPPEGEGQPRPPQGEAEEGHGPGAIMVGPEGAAKAMERLRHRDDRRARWCHGKVLPVNGLNVRTGPGTGYRVVDALEHGTHVVTNWNSIQRRDGYLWVKLRYRKHWIADYKVGHGNGKWYVKYFNC